MPLLFLDDDEHWPLSNPDWFLHTADVRQCPTADSFTGCRPVSPATMADPSLDFLQFDPEAYRTGVPPVMFVNQTEPMQRPAPDAEPVASMYRFFDYWWYYSFNRSPYWEVTQRLGLDFFDHLSDWEGITVASLPGRQDRFDFVAMSAHEASWNYLPGVLRCGEGLIDDARHVTSCIGRKRVNTYAADGTHANYPRRCGKSLSQITPPGPGICEQTGVPLPEGRFNGNDDGPSLMPTTNLVTLARLAPADWPGYAGSWAAGAGPIESPMYQDRFRDPLDGDRECTRRWEGDSGATTCGPEFEQPPPGRLAALAAQARGSVDPCEAWFGPTVSVSVCQPKALRVALAQGTLGQEGTLRSTGPAGPSDVAPGISQIAGDPVTAQRTLSVFGSGEPAEVRARIAVNHRSIDARFDDVALAPNRPLVISVTRAGAIRARTPQGRILRPSARRRTDLRRPPRIARAVAIRRAGRVIVRFPRVTGRVVIDLLASRSGRRVTTFTVSGASRRAARYPPPRTRPRYASVRRLSRTGVPSAARIVRIRGS